MTRRLLLLTIPAAAFAQNFFNGGTKHVEEGELRAARIDCQVLDPNDEPVADAHVQIIGGENKRVFHDVRTDRRGRFHLPRLTPGTYRMGVSGRRFQLHLWNIKVVKGGVRRNLFVRLRPAS